MNSNFKTLAGKSAAGLPAPASKIAQGALLNPQSRQQSQLSTRSVLKESETYNDIDNDDDDDDDSEDSERDSTSKPATKVTSAKDLEWSQEEQQSVMKFYGLETLFPNVWGDEPATIETQKTSEETEAINKAIAIEEDTSDPLKIRGKIKRPKWMKNKTDVSIFISEKTFSPKTFLKEVHKNTDFKELEQGVIRLKQSIAERNETTKGLVKKHFAKFVNAKSTIDTFYKEMRAKNLVSTEDYGVGPFLKELLVLQKDANALYGPVLERRTKAAKLRVALSILEQWKFFFNLASSLKEMVRKGRYDAAVRDYKKGKNIIQSSFKDDRKDKTRLQFNKSESLLPKNYQSVFEKLWEEVEKVVADFREELFKSLRVASTPVETQEKIIGYLNELDSKRDPVWCYLDTQYTWVLENLMIVYNRHLKGMRGIIGVRCKKIHDILPLIDIMNKIQDEEDTKQQKAKDIEKLNKSIADLDILISRDYLNVIDQKIKKEQIEKNLLSHQIHNSLPWNLNDMKRALLCVTSESFEAQFGKELLVCFWKKTREFVSDLSQILTNHLPSFFRTCRMAIDEKYVKKTEGKKFALNDRIRDSQSMINNVFDMIRIMIDYIFFINKADIDGDEMSDDEYSEDESSLNSFSDLNSIIELKKYKDYKSGSNLDLLTQADSVWKTFQHLSGSLIKLPASIFSSMMTVHPLILNHYATQIMDDLHDCIDKIKISCPKCEGFVLIEPLEVTVDKVKSHLVRRMCTGWIDVSKAMHQFEFWEFENHVHTEINPEKVKQDSTHLMKLNNKIFKLMLRSLSIVLFGSQKRENHNPDFNANQHHIEKIRLAITECSFGLLDGFQWHVGNWRDPDASVQFEELEGWIPEMKTPKLHTILTEQKFKFGQFIPPDCAHFVETIKPRNFRDLDARSFMTLSNIHYMLKIIVPESKAIVKDKFNLDISLDQQHISEISDVLRRIIIMNYAKRQHVIIGSLVKSAILYSGLDWSSLKGPIPIRPQFLQLLQHLIYIHASISDVSKSMVKTIFSEILLFLVQELLLCFRQVDMFNIPGMLQATLETEFLDSTLKAFETPQSLEMFAQLYDLFEMGTNPDEEIDPEVMNEHLSSVKSFLDEAKNSTGTQYRCFLSVHPDQ